MKISIKITSIVFLLSFFQLISCKVEPPSIKEKGEELITMIQEGSFQDATKILSNWPKKSPDSIGYFLQSQIAYLQGKLDSMNYYRGIALNTESSKKEICNWIQNELIDSTSFQAYLIGISNILTGDTSLAKQNFEKSLHLKDSTIDTLLVQQTLLSFIDSTAMTYSIIRRKNPLSYYGDLEQKNGFWLPLEQNFSVTGGILHSGYGRRYEAKAKFGDWQYVRKEKNGKKLSWAAMLTEGEIYATVNEKGTPNNLKKDLKIEIACHYESIPLDYFGRFQKIKLVKAKKQSYPVLIVPFFKYQNDEFRLYQLGDNFQSSSNHFKQEKTSSGFFGGMLSTNSKGEWSGRVYQEVEF